MQYARSGVGAVAPTESHDLFPVVRNPTGFVGGTRILTLDGMIAVDCLAPGDRIVTRDSGMVRLQAVQSVVHAAVSPVILSPGARGHFRPDAEFALGGSHLVLLRDWRAKALYGQSVAMVPVQRLVDGTSIRVGAEQARLRLYTLGFEAPHVIYAEGVCVAAG